MAIGDVHINGGLPDLPLQGILKHNTLHHHFHFHIHQPHSVHQYHLSSKRPTLYHLSSKLSIPSYYTKQKVNFSSQGDYEEDKYEDYDKEKECITIQQALAEMSNRLDERLKQLNQTFIKLSKS